MSKRRKKGKKRKNLAISAFGLNSVADQYETAPLYQSKFHEGDMVWLADEYQRRGSSEPSLTLEEFAAQYGVSADELRAHVPDLSGETDHSIILWHGTTKSRAESILKEGFRVNKLNHKFHEWTNVTNYSCYLLICVIRDSSFFLLVNVFGFYNFLENNVGARRAVPLLPRISNYEKSEIETLNLYIYRFIVGSRPPLIPMGFGCRRYWGCQMAVCRIQR